jgi:Chitin binding Peritrophin-A domain
VSWRLTDCVVATGGRISVSTAATTVADLVSDAEDYETDATDESDEQLPETSITPPIATTPTVELTTTATTTTTTAPTTTTTTATTTTTTTTTERTTTTEPANLAKRIKAIRGRLQRPRPVASGEELPRAVAADQEDEGSEIPPVRTPSTTRRPAVRASTTRTPSTRAPIKIAIPAPEGRLPGDEVFRRPSASDQDDLFGTGNTGNTDHSPTGIGNHNGNVVEIDEDGRVFCFDVGNFAYPDDCRKFVQCAKENGVIRGWVHTCPRILSFDPVGAICNWGSPLRCLKV